MLDDMLGRLHTSANIVGISHACSLKKSRDICILIIFIILLCHFLQTVAHSAELVCNGLSIYKVKAKILQKSTYF